MSFISGILNFFPHSQTLSFHVVSYWDWSWAQPWWPCQPCGGVSSVTLDTSRRDPTPKLDLKPTKSKTFLHLPDTNFIKLSPICAIWLKILCLKIGHFATQDTGVNPGHKHAWVSLSLLNCDSQPAGQPDSQPGQYGRPGQVDQECWNKDWVKF